MKKNYVDLAFKALILYKTKLVFKLKRIWGQLNNATFYALKILKVGLYRVIKHSNSISTGISLILKLILLFFVSIILVYFISIYTETKRDRNIYTLLGFTTSNSSLIPDITSDYLGAKIFEHLERIESISNLEPLDKFEGLVKNDQQVSFEMEIEGVEVPISEIFEYFTESFLGKKKKEISGNLIQTEDKLTLFISIHGKPIKKIEIEIRNGNWNFAFEKLIRYAVKYILKETHPLILIDYYIQTNQLLLALDLAKTMQIPSYEESYRLSEIARVYELLEDYINAEKFYSAALQKKPDYGFPYEGLGRIMYFKNDVDKALDLWRTPIEIRSYRFAHLNLGAHFAAKNNFKQAEKEFKSYLDTPPLNKGDKIEDELMTSWVNYLLGCLEIKKKNFDKSYDYFQLAFEIHPDFSIGSMSTTYPLTFLNFDFKNYVKGFGPKLEENQVANLLLQDSCNSLLLSFMGDFYYRQNDFESAKYHYQIALENDSNYICSLLGLANVHLQNHEFSKAEKLFRKTIKIIPNCYLGWFGLGLTLERQNLNLDALEILDLSLEKESYDNRILNLYGDILRKIGDKQGALRKYMESLDIQPNYSISLLDMGLLMLEFRDYRIAEEYFLKVVEVDSISEQAYLHLAQIKVHLRQFEEAKKYLKKILENNDSSIITLNHLFSIHALLNEHKACEEIIQKKFDKGISDEHSYLGVFFYLSKNKLYERAKYMLNKSLKLNPKNPIANLQMGYLKLNNFESIGINYMDKVQVVTPGYVDQYLENNDYYYNYLANDVKIAGDKNDWLLSYFFNVKL